MIATTHQERGNVSRVGGLGSVGRTPWSAAGPPAGFSPRSEISCSSSKGLGVGVGRGPGAPPHQCASESRPVRAFAVGPHDHSALVSSPSHIAGNHRRNCLRQHAWPTVTTNPISCQIQNKALTPLFALLPRPPPPPLRYREGGGAEGTTNWLCLFENYLDTTLGRVNTNAGIRR
jgi:hypothetical protein